MDDIMGMIATEALEPCGHPSWREIDLQIREAMQAAMGIPKSFFGYYRHLLVPTKEPMWTYEQLMELTTHIPEHRRPIRLVMLLTPGDVDATRPCLRPLTGWHHVSFAESYWMLTTKPLDDLIRARRSMHRQNIATLREWSGRGETMHGGC